MSDTPTPSGNDALAQNIVKMIPKDFHHITITSLLPVLSVIMAHAQEMQGLNGDEKKELVLSCLKLLIDNMPFPERQVIAPIADAVAPVAVEGIIRGSRFAVRHVEELMISERKRQQDPASRQLLSRITWPNIPRKTNKTMPISPSEKPTAVYRPCVLGVRSFGMQASTRLAITKTF